MKKMNTHDASQLIAAGRDVKTPFRLLANRTGMGQVEILFLSILRLLPARRIVALAEVDGQKVLIKMFLGRAAGKYVDRERAGVLAIAGAGVRTPELLWEGESGNSRLLVFRYLPDAVNLAEQWSKSREHGERINILVKAMKVMSSLHRHGIVQNDIHLENFLLSEGEIYTIDGDGVEQIGKAALTEEASLSNLSLIFAQLYPRFDVLVAEVFASYESYRGWATSEQRLQSFQRKVTSSRQVRKQNFIAKTFRDCTRFLCRKSISRFEVCERSAYSRELADLMKSPDKFIELGTILKKGNSSTVALVNLADRTLVVKRYNIKNLQHGMRRAFRKSRAWHSWANAHLMEFLGIPALKPIAMIELRLGPIRKTAYLITEYIEGPDALQCLTGTKNLKGKLESLVAILQNLSEVQVTHGDLKATNFIMTEQGPVLIDLDGMKEHDSQQSFEEAFGRDLRRFIDNWQNYPRLLTHFSDLLRGLAARHNVKL